MKYRSFGRLGWLVGEIGYGMWGLAGWTGSDDDETAAALERAVELGCNFFDTAWAYGNGHSERLLGALVRNHPAKELYVATKVPPKNFKWPSSAVTRSTTVSRLTTFVNMRKRVWRILICRGSTYSNSTSGKIPGPTTKIGSAPSRI